MDLYSALENCSAAEAACSYVHQLCSKVYFNQHKVCHPIHDNCILKPYSLLEYKACIPPTSHAAKLSIQTLKSMKFNKQVYHKLQFLFNMMRETTAKTETSDRIFSLYGHFFPQHKSKRKQR